MRILIFLFILSFCINLSSAVSQIHGKSSFDDWLNGEYMTGNWGGVRSDLINKGVTPFGNFHTTFLGNPVGGESKGFEYAGQLIVGTEMDLERIAGINGPEP